MESRLLDIIQSTVTLLDDVSGVDRVTREEGSTSAWTLTPGQKKSFWVVGHDRSDVQFPGVSQVQYQTYLRRLRKIRVDGWMPAACSLSTGTHWRDLIDDVLLKLTQNASLGQITKMVALPALEFNRLDPFASLNQGDEGVICHHCRIAFSVIAFYPVPVS